MNRDRGNIAKGKNRETGGGGDEVVNTQKPASKAFGVNERGQRIGEGHPGAVLTDHEVDLMLELREEGKSYTWLAEKFEVAKGTVAKICTGQRRAQVVVVFRRARGL